MRKLFLIIPSLFCISVIRAQDHGSYIRPAEDSIPTETQQTIVVNSGNDKPVEGEPRDILTDTTVYVNNTMIPPDTVRSWKENKRFAYVKTLDSLLKQAQKEMIDEYKKETKPNLLQRILSSGFARALFWIVAISFVLFILYRIFLSNGIFSRRAENLTANELPAEELVSTTADYERLVKQSLAERNYRMAVRYLFLRTLSHLSDKEYVNFSADKTNYQYVQEIRNDKKNEFASLVLNYEYIWYGNFPLDAELYQGIENKFNNFINRI